MQIVSDRLAGPASKPNRMPVVGALLLSRVVRSMLVGVEPVDPTSFGVAVGVLVLAALAAIIAPAARAARLDPALALKGD